MEKKNFFSATRIAIIALFGALSGVLYIFGFPISAAFPVWLELNFSDIPALIGTFALGPLSGTIILVVKILIKLVFKSTSTVFVGELADFLIGLAFLLPAGLLYRKKRTFKGALAGLAIGTACSVAVSILTNWLVLVPFYVKLLFKGNWDAIVGLMKPLFPSCTRETFYDFYLWVSVLPFNVMRCLIASTATLLVYKHISRAINRIAEKLTPKGQNAETENKKQFIITLCVCVVLIVLMILFALLHYFFWRG
ncbi:MAG: ECF transporter S component [Clostridia bacterium]|jgi:riboflavin transporter FmnP|nr:ECF transporter S component [Clostridia bacterium]